jgi:hypothetical protein
MYCSSCGNEINKGLNYCNSCGARVFDPEKEKNGSNFEIISTSIGFIGLGGIIGFIFLVKTLLPSDLDAPAIIIILLAFLATVFGISYLLIKQLSEKSKDNRSSFEIPGNTPRAVKAADTNQLEEPKQTPVSVIENTTRTLDKVPVERN